MFRHSAAVLCKREFKFSNRQNNHHRIVEPVERRFTIDFEGALKFDAWRAAAFTFPYKTRIAQFPAEARIISVSNKIQRQTLAPTHAHTRTYTHTQGMLVFSSPRRCHPPPPFILPPSFLLQIQFSVASLHHTPPPTATRSPALLSHTYFLSLSRSALFSGRNIARNNVKYLLSGRLFPSVRRDKHHYVMYIKPRANRDRSARICGQTEGKGREGANKLLRTFAKD